MITRVGLTHYTESFKSCYCFMSLNHLKYFYLLDNSVYLLSNVFSISTENQMAEANSAKLALGLFESAVKKLTLPKAFVCVV